MIIELGQNTGLDSSGIIEVEATSSVIQLEAPPLSQTTSYVELFYLVRQNGDTLTDHSGNKLTAWLAGQTRSNIIDLGA